MHEKDQLLNSAAYQLFSLANKTRVSYHMCTLGHYRADEYACAEYADVAFAFETSSAKP